jgi:WD40 repeat protein
MTTQEFKRKLAAILRADMKRYSRLQSTQDEMRRKKEAKMKWKKTWFLLGMIWILVLGQGSWLNAMAQTQEPILRLDVGTHNAGVWSLALDSSNRILVTGSEDKTARVWDISGRGELMRVLRPPVGEGEEGHIFAVALSPDAKTVACGGRTGSAKQGDACVYLFDRATGAIIRRIGGFPGWIQHLTYTPNGRFLAVVTGEAGGKAGWSGMKIFRLPDYALVAEDREYGNFVKWVESNPTGTRVATSCYDGFVRLYDLSTLSGHDSFSPRPISPVSKIRPPGGQRPWGLAFSPDGAFLAVGFNLIPKVDVLQVKGHTLEHAYSPDTKGVRGGGHDLRAVAWSSDGRFLYAGGRHQLRRVGQIRKWDEGGRGRYRDLPVGVDLVLLYVLPLRAGGVAYSSRDGSFGQLNARDGTTPLSPQAIPIYEGNDKGFLVSPDGTVIQFAYERGGKSPAHFSVKERRLLDASSNLGAGLNTTFTLQAPITEGLGITDWKNSLTPKLKGNPLAVKQEFAKCLAIRPDKSGFLLGTSISLFFFNSTGKEVWRVRMPGGVWGVNTNGRFALAALGDGTVRWYRMRDGKEVLAFFPHADRKRWILWTPSGYYDASPGAEELIGWHVNNGSDQAADFFPISRFRPAYYRPDVVAKVLETMDEPEAIKLANKESTKKVQEVPVARILPPVVSILSPKDGSETSAKEIEVKFEVRSPSGEPVTKVRVLVDGRPIGRGLAIKEIQKDQGIQTARTPIPEKDTEISIIAENKYAASVPATVSLKWSGKVKEEEFTIKPKLYVLAIGVSKYKDKNLTLQFASKDAADFAESLLKQKGGLYRDVVVKVITDERATRDEIIDGFDWISKETTSKDVAMIFLAGHGVNDSGGAYYYLPVNTDLGKLRRTGVLFAEMKNTVASVAGKAILFIDTCHAGNVMGARGGASDITGVVNELASAENGAVVFASSTGRQYSFEDSAWENGAFTKAVVEGIEGRADYTGKGRITVNMLDLYISERVKELTKGKQTPATAKPNTIPDFPLALKK